MEQQNHQTTNDNINTSTNLHQDMNTNTNTNKANGNGNISGNNGNINGNGGFLCRQSSTRWTPTTEQIRILKELYYNNGVRSPSAEQIQRISARLRQYGKIEGKNVFYWFQNHKARERQKKRFTSDHHNHNNNNNMMIMQRSNNYASVGNNNIITNTNTIISASSAWKTHHVDHQYHDQFDDHIDHQHHHQEYQLFHHGSSHIKYPNLSPVVSCGMSSSISSSSAASVVGVNGQMGNIQYGYGGVANKEKAFREYGSSGVNGGSTTQNLGWVGSSDPFSSPYGLFDNKRSNIAIDYDTDDHDYHDENHDQASPEIETLPLFPMHGEDCYGNMMMKPNFSDSGAGGYYSGGHVSSGRTSLELSLNSYGHISPN